jgi:hypothetical protein
MTTTLSLDRDSGYADRVRDYRVLVDGLEIGRIANGEQRSFEIDPGPHELSVKVDWCRTDPIPFVAVKDLASRFQCGSNLRGIRLVFALYYARFARRKYLWFGAGWSSCPVGSASRLPIQSLGGG